MDTGGGSFSVAAASDVSLSAPAEGQAIIYQLSKWRNARAALAYDGGREVVSSVTASSTATTLNLKNGNVFNVTLSSSTTFTFALGTVTTSGVANSFTVYLKQDATGSRTVTWPSSVKWSGGAPTLSTGANSLDIVVFESINGGTTWYGSLVGTNFI